MDKQYAHQGKRPECIDIYDSFCGVCAHVYVGFNLQNYEYLVDLIITFFLRIFAGEKTTNIVQL